MFPQVVHVHGGEERESEVLASSSQEERSELQLGPCQADCGSASVIDTARIWMACYSNVVGMCHESLEVLSGDAGQIQLPLQM